MTTTWLVANNGNDANGGTSKVIRSSGTDGVVNTTAGLTKITYFGSLWSSSDIGHGICASGVFRLITAFTPGGTVASCTTQSNTTVLSANFTTAMVGQAIAGTDIPANTVITAVSVGVSATISNAATGSHGSLTLTIYGMFTTTGNVAMVAATGKSWVVGGTWATWGNSFLSTNSPITNGDTVYVGSGIYREQVTANLTSPTTMVNVIGDVDGSQTGNPPGEVRLTGFNVTGFIATTFNPALNMNTKNFLSFSNIVFVGGGTNTFIFNNLGHDHSFTDCAFFGSSPTGSKTATVDTALNWIFDRCYVWLVGGNFWSITAPTSTVADYDLNVIFRNGIVLNSAFSTTFNTTSSGGNTFRGGGVHLRSSLVFTGVNTAFSASGSLSTSIPCTVKDCFLVGNNSTILSAGNSGQIIEDYNILTSNTTIRSSVTAGFHSTSSTTYAMETLFHMGQERIWGGMLRPFGTPVADTPMVGWGEAVATGNDTIPTVDNRNRLRPSGAAKIIFSGTLTSGGTATATDSTAAFGGDGQLAGASLAITGGTGSGQTTMIKSHTSTAITVFGNWNTQPDNTSTYMIYWGSPAFVGKATSGSPTTLTQSNATWDTNQWIGFTLTITAGTGSGQTTFITSNTATALTGASFSPSPDSTSVYKMYRGTSETTVNNSAGALERHDTAGKETVLTDAGGIAWNLYGWADQTLRIPLKPTVTQITVKCSFDSSHGNTNKPQMILVADPEIGIVGQTITATGTAGSGTFETLSTTTFQPTALGVAEVRLVSRSDSIRGRAIFDTVGVS